MIHGIKIAHSCNRNEPAQKPRISLMKSIETSGLMFNLLGGSNFLPADGKLFVWVRASLMFYFPLYFLEAGSFKALNG